MTGFAVLGSSPLSIYGGGYMTLYGHADALLKTAGDWVESGEPIAEAGDSGGRYEPGIY